VRRLVHLLGNLAWWCGFPALWLLLNRSERTRLVLTDGEGKVLVVRGWLAPNSKWNLPGGGLHRGEDPLVGLLRETNEEVGIVLDPKTVRKLGTGNVTSSGLRLRLHFFAATLPGRSDTRLQWYEIADAGWVDPSTLSVATAHTDVLESLRFLA